MVRRMEKFKNSDEELIDIAVRTANQKKGYQNKTALTSGQVEGKKSNEVDCRNQDESLIDIMVRAANRRR